MKLSIDFAFEGFRIVRQKPQVILAWGIVSLIGNGLGLFVLMSMAGSAFQQLMGLQTNPAMAQDPQAVLALMEKLAPAYLVVLVIGLLTNAIVTCAVFRCVFETGKGGFGYLALGGDEVRQFLLNIVFFLVIIGLEIGAAIVACIVGGIIAMVLAIVSKPLAAIGIIVGVVLFLWIFFWGLLRLSLNSAQSFAEKKFNVFGSFAITKGRSFTLLGGYVITAILALFVYGLCMLIFMAVAAAINHGNVGALSVFNQAQMMTPESMKNPLVIAYFVVIYVLVMPLMMAMMYGAPAAAYKMLRGHTPAVQNVF